MAIIRNANREKYTVIDYQVFKDKRLSLKARGMLVTLLSLSDNWRFNENGLEELFCDGLTSIKTSLKELENLGYLVRKQLKDEKGHFLKNEWIIYEKPLSEKPITDTPMLENDTQYNIKKTNIKKDNICPSDDEQESLSSLADTEQEDKEAELAKNFELIWEIYPRKEGKNQAFNHYKAWIKGRKYAGKLTRLTNYSMYEATRNYADLVEREKTEKRFIKMGSTFFNDAIMEFVITNESE